MRGRGAQHQSKPSIVQLAKLSYTSNSTCCRQEFLLEQVSNACYHHPELVENQELKGKVIELRGKLMDKSVQLNHLEGTMVSLNLKNEN